MNNKKSFWSFSAKDLVYILIIGILCFFGYRIYSDLKSDIQQSHVAYAQISETLARAENRMVTKLELDAFARQTGIDLKAIKKDLKGLGADLSAVGETIASIEGQIEENQGSDDVVDHDPGEQPENCELCDVYGYTASTQIKDIKVGEMPHAKVEFDASKEKPWTVKSDDIDVKVVTVLGESDEDDVTIFYHTISMFNKTRPELADKEFKLKITSSEFVQTLDNSKEFYWWAPHLDLSFDNGFILDTDGDDFYRAGASLGFNVMAYGRNKHDNDWRFIRLGVGINSKEHAYVTLEPARYNIGKFIPLISDLWLGAGALYDGGWGISISIGTTL
jgi:hypothetical protein